MTREELFRESRHMDTSKILLEISRQFGSKLIVARIPIGSIDYGNEVDMAKVDAIHKAMMDNSAMDPAIVYPIFGNGGSTRYKVLDGNHRAAAAARTGRGYLDCYVPEYFLPKFTPASTDPNAG